MYGVGVSVIDLIYNLSPSLLEYINAGLPPMNIAGDGLKCIPYIFSSHTICINEFQPGVAVE